MNYCMVTHGTILTRSQLSPDAWDNFRQPSGNVLLVMCALMPYYVGEAVQLMKCY